VRCVATTYPASSERRNKAFTAEVGCYAAQSLPQHPTMAQRDDSTLLFLLLLLAIAVPTPTTSAGCPSVDFQSMIIKRSIKPLFSLAYNLRNDCNENNINHPSNVISKVPAEYVNRLGGLIESLLQTQKALEEELGRPCWTTMGQEIFYEGVEDLVGIPQLIIEMLPKSECIECFGFGPNGFDEKRRRLDLLEPGCLAGNGNRCSGTGSGRDAHSNDSPPTPIPTPSAVNSPTAPASSAGSSQPNGDAVMSRGKRETAKPNTHPPPHSAVARKIRKAQTKIDSVQSKIANEVKKPGSTGGKTSKVKKLKAWLRRLWGKLRSLFRRKRKMNTGN
jgi:hypothetical protein